MPDERISSLGLPGLAGDCPQIRTPAAASYTLIGAIICLEHGYAIDEWRGTSPWFLLGGLLLGIVVGFYELAKTVWRQGQGKG